MSKAWWHREPQTLEQLKPDFVPAFNAPLMRQTQILEAVVRYKQQGIPLKAISRETGVHQTSLSNYCTGKWAPGPKAAVKLSWLFRALDAKQVKFIRMKGREFGPRGTWALVRADAPDNALVAKTTLGTCPCGRYESCPCSINTRRVHADFDVAVPKKRVRRRIRQRKARAKVPQVPV